MALNITNEIVDIASLLNTYDFNNFMNMFKNLKSHLQIGTEFQIVESHEHSGNLQNTATELHDLAKICNQCLMLPQVSLEHIVFLQTPVILIRLLVKQVNENYRAEFNIRILVNVLNV